VTLQDDGRALLAGAVKLRRRLHRHPEVGLELPDTQAAVREGLDGLGMAVVPGRGLSSVVATLEGAHAGPTILLRADMDALPMEEDTGLEFASQVDGAMHACGHDSHVAMLVGAAGLLSTRRDALHGRVRFMFQPGEEGYHGARLMLDDGLLDGDDPPAAAFAIHVISTEPSGMVLTRAGPMMAASDVLDLTILGRGGHASTPSAALDPVPVAAEIIQALQTFVTRRVHPFDPAVVTIARVEAGSTYNVIPESATLWGTIRTFSDGTRDTVLEGVRRLAEGIAEAHGLRAELTLTRGYPVTANDPDMAAFALEVGEQVAGPGNARRMPSPGMFAEDFSYILQRVPGAMVFLGAAPPGSEPQPNHSNRMTIDESAMATGIALYSGLALRFLSGERAS
jgi:hippurate hydrolase